MTREIKFRAWDKETKKMHYQLVKPRTDKNTRDELIIQFDCTGYSARTESKFIGSDCLMQYTGLKDKNGREIFEGDILKISYGTVNFENKKEVVTDVYFENGAFRYRHKDGSGSVLDFNSAKIVSGYESITQDIKVVGNIYEGEIFKKN